MILDPRFLRLACCLALAGLGACGQEQYLSAAASPSGDRRQAGRAEGHALLRGDRQHRGGQLGQSGRARAGLPDRDRLHGRRAGQEGHSTSSPSSRSPISSSCNRRRRPKPPRRPTHDPDPGRFRAPAGTGAAPGSLEGRIRQCDREPRHRQGEGAAGAGRHQARRRSISTIPTSWRRSTASSRRARSRSASWSAAAARECSPPSCSSIRST